MRSCDVIHMPSLVCQTDETKLWVELSLSRARLLRAFVPTDEIDGEALEELLRDDLITRDPHELAAPVHDVIEDWAIIRLD